MDRSLTRVAILARRRRLRRKYPHLYDAVTRVLFEHDPIHIAATEDEYEPEVELIVPELAACVSSAQVTDLVHRVFKEMFTPGIAGARSRCEVLAKDIWRLSTRAKARASA